RKRDSRAGRSAPRWRGRAGGWWKPTRESQVSMSHVDDGILHGYLDGELAPAEAREVDAHLAQCPECRRRVDEGRALIARAAELPRQEPARREPRVAAPGAARTPPADPLAPPQARARVDNIALLPPEPVGSADTAAAGVADSVQLEERPARISLRKESGDERGQWQKGGAISIDSARRVLGTDPLVVPGVPIEALYRGLAIGSAAVVIVEQALDATTMIEVINARSAPQLPDQAVVASA